MTSARLPGSMGDKSGDDSRGHVIEGLNGKGTLKDVRGVKESDLHFRISILAITVQRVELVYLDV